METINGAPSLLIFFIVAMMYMVLGICLVWICIMIHKILVKLYSCVIKYGIRIKK